MVPRVRYCVWRVYADLFVPGGGLYLVVFECVLHGKRAARVVVCGDIYVNGVALLKLHGGACHSRKLFVYASRMDWYAPALNGVVAVNCLMWMARMGE